MPQLEILIPGTARARNADPQTSYDAAASVRHITETHNNILRVFKKYGGMTDEDLQRNYTWEGFTKAISPSGLRSRRAELVEAGYLIDSGARGKTASGRSCIIWKVTV